MQHDTPVTVGSSEDWWLSLGETRRRLRELLEAIGSDALEERLLQYVIQICDGNCAAVVVPVEGTERRVATISIDGSDANAYGDAALAIAGRMEAAVPFTTVRRSVVRVGNFAGQSDVPSIVQDPMVYEHLDRFAITEELRLHVDLGQGRAAAILCGRRNSGGRSVHASQFGEIEGSLSFVRAMLLAHDRCQLERGNPAEQAGDNFNAQRRLVRAFEGRGLTNREGEIASKVLLGYSTLAIAMDLGISENTVKVHRKHLNQKLGVRTQAELFGFAYRALMSGEPL